MKTNQKVFKLASALLHYPDKTWLKEVAYIEAEINSIEEPVIRSYLQSFLHYMKSTSFDQLCENYVYTFDFHGIVTLNLTYHVFKDSRKRGEALVQLRKIFKESKLEAKSDELPDYLPLILEFLSVAKDEQAVDLLKLHIKSIQKLDQTLTENDSPYHFLLKAVQDVAYRTLQNKHVS
ncbi:nitrate reductase molybdenum cofactor assembly chaperone [Virgibacillus soli]|uniref:Nitrate reductase molybdenum cofactor assembly chaperone n=1 Tax=Paracerasibacillus soli TaxID=480284 RepID=A0ABU5CPH5_9BACI|nr:nitrate reductase molybdenum cofactor assembly chaperone [Virgibacillus soli]MDY0408259.1 nitrate reductase molybdenum cofactor assembly chaperone [Virgibacillus soli]